MKEIVLTQSKVAVVDDDDYDRISQYRWRAQCGDGGKWYAVRATRFDGKYTAFLMHREIWGLFPGDPRQVDHIHHNGLDNRRSETRIVDRSQNQFNRRWVKGYSKHRDGFQSHMKGKMLGHFETAEEARSAYLAARAKYNIPDVG